jgi:hypothetical protein
MENTDGILTRGSRVARGAQVALCALGSALTATLYGSFFAGRGYLAPLAAMALLGAVAGHLAAAFSAGRGGRRRIRVLIASAGAVLVFAVTAWALVLGRGLPDLTMARSGWRGLSGGWASMLSIGAPAPVDAQLLLTPAAVTYAAAFAAAALIRRRAVLAQAAAVLPAEIAGLLVASDQPGGHLPQAAALLGVLALLCVLRADPARRGPAVTARPAGAPAERPGQPDPASRALAPGRARRRTVKTAGRVGTVLLIVGAATGTVAALPLAQGADRYDPHYRPVISLPPAISPLSSVRAQLLTTPPVRLFTVHVSTPAGLVLDRVQTTTLDQFDGSDWTSSDSYDVSGGALAPGPALPGADDVSLEVTVSGALAGPFLPSAGRPTSIAAAFSGGQIGFAAGSGDLVTDAATLQGGSYTVEGAIRPPSAAGLADALAGTGPAFAPYTALGALVPSRLVAFANQYTEGARAPYQALLNIATTLRQDPYSLAAVPGFSYATLAAMLFGDPRQPGDAAQHAAVFAVLARAAGLPTRIAVGYLLRGGVDGDYTVTTADAYAWDQVYFQGYGWVDFDPTDVQKDGPANPPPNKHVIPQSQAPSPPVAVTSDIVVIHTGAAALGPGGASGSLAGLALSAIEYAALALPCLVVLFAVANLGAKAGRRARRRRRGDTRRRATGAWHEALDVLREAGLEVPLWLGARALAASLRPEGASDPARGRRSGRGAHGRRTLSAGAAATLGSLASRAEDALYQADAPDAGEVAEAWRLERRLRRELRPGAARRLVRRALTPAITIPLAPRWPGRPRRTVVRTGARL